jgi:hypothetical protein
MATAVCGRFGDTQEYGAADISMAAAYEPELRFDVPSNGPGTILLDRARGVFLGIFGRRGKHPLFRTSPRYAY